MRRIDTMRFSALPAYSLKLAILPMQNRMVEGDYIKVLLLELKVAARLKGSTKLTIKNY